MDLVEQINQYILDTKNPYPRMHIIHPLTFEIWKYEETGWRILQFGKKKKKKKNDAV